MQLLAIDYSELGYRHATVFFCNEANSRDDSIKTVHTYIENFL